MARGRPADPGRARADRDQRRDQAVPHGLSVRPHRKARRAVRHGLAGWYADYPDPSDLLNYLFDGRSIRAIGNSNHSYFDDPVYNRKLAAAARLTGPRRYAAYQALDADLLRNAAPAAPLFNFGVPEFFSARIGCKVYQPVYESTSRRSASSVLAETPDCTGSRGCLPDQRDSKVARARFPYGKERAMSAAGHPQAEDPSTTGKRAVRTPAVWGFVFGGIQAASPLAFWWLDAATVYAVGLALIASVYIGFAVADGRWVVIAFETNVAGSSSLSLPRPSRNRHGCS